MNTPSVPNTAVKLSDIKNAFPGRSNAKSLTSYRAVHPNAPSGSDPINLLSFRGLTAVAPSFTTVSTGSQRATLNLVGNSNTMAIYTNNTDTDDSIITVTLQDYLTNKSFQGNVSFSLNTPFPNGITFNSLDGTITIDPTITNTGTTEINENRTITITNAWGNTFSLNVLLTLGPVIGSDNPLTVPSGYAMLMMAGIEQTLSGTDVTQWSPAAGSTAGAVFQPIDAAKPTYYATGGGKSASLPYVSFDGTVSLRNTSGEFIVNTANGGGFTLIAYVHFPTLQSDFPRIFMGNGTGGYTEFIRHQTLLQATAHQINFAFVQGSAFTPVGEWVMLAMRYSNDTKVFQIFKDSLENTAIRGDASTSIYTVNLSYGNNVAIASTPDGAARAVVDINFMAIYPRALTDLELGQFFEQKTFNNGILNPSGETPAPPEPEPEPEPPASNITYPTNWIPTVESTPDSGIDQLDGHPFFTIIRGYRHAYITLNTNAISIDANGYHVIRFTIQGTSVYNQNPPVVWYSTHGERAKVYVQTSSPMRLAYVTKHSGNIAFSMGHPTVSPDGWSPEPTILYGQDNSVTDSSISDVKYTDFFFGFHNIFSPDVATEPVGEYSIAFAT